MPTATGKDIPQLVHVKHPKQTLAADHVKPIPSLVLKLVGILHIKKHYVVLEVDIAERQILIFDGLSRDLLQWTDTLSLFSRSACRWICPLMPHLQSLFQMQLVHLFQRAAGDLSQSSMYIPLLLQSNRHLTVETGDLSGVSSYTRRMDLIVVQSPAST